MVLFLVSDSHPADAVAVQFHVKGVLKIRLESGLKIKLALNSVQPHLLITHGMQASINFILLFQILKQ